MIELEKQEEPTQQEIQNYVNQVYDYAIDLYTNQKLSWEQVRDELIRQGVEVEDASAVVENLQNQEIKEKQEAGNKELGYGLLWAVGGIALTVITGGTFIFWGAVVWGIWLILKGLNHKMG